jgi:hypothetical protein
MTSFYRVNRLFFSVFFSLLVSSSAFAGELKVASRGTLRLLDALIANAEQLEKVKKVSNVVTAASTTDNKEEVVYRIVTRQAQIEEGVLVSRGGAILIIHENKLAPPNAEERYSTEIQYLK